MKKFLHAVGILGLILVASNAFAADVYILRPNAEKSTYDSRGFAHTDTSAHFAVYWNDQTEKGVAFTQAKAQQALTNLELAFANHVTKLGFQAPYAGQTVKYKVGAFIGDWGLSGGLDGSDPGMWVGPGAESDQWGLSHEFTHALQGGTGAFTTTYDMTNNYVGWIWESHANWMAHQQLSTNAHCSELSVREAEWYYGSTRNRYCDWQFMEYLKEHQGGVATLDSLWMQNYPAQGTTAYKDEDPIRALMRIKSWNFAQLGDIWGDFSMHMARADFVNGTVYRSAWWQNRPEEFMRLQQIALNPLDTANKRYVVPFEMAPQRYANNIVRLYRSNTTDSVKIEFRGVVQTKNNITNWAKSLTNDPDSVSLPGSNWHFGLALVDTSTSTPTFRYVGPYSGTTGSMVALPKATEQVFLVVSATPTNRQLIKWDQAYYTIYRYPWMVQINGALPEGAQASAFVNTVSGKAWANGGGFVANTATVASTVYVGPLARVLGNANVSGTAQILGRATVKGSAQVSGSAIITDTAVVAGSAVVKDNAKITGHAYLNTGTISGNGQVNGWATISTNQNAGAFSVSGNAVVGGAVMAFGPAQLSNTAQVLGDAELYGVTASVGVFYGIVDDGVVTNTGLGSTLTAAKPEVTIPPPYTWYDAGSSSSVATVSSSSVVSVSSSSKAVSSSSVAVSSSSAAVMTMQPAKAYDPKSQYMFYNNLGGASLQSPIDGILLVYKTDGTMVHEQSVRIHETVAMPQARGMYILHWLK